MDSRATMQSQLEQQQTELEALRKETRTQAAALRAIQGDLERASTARDELLDLLGHELRTPLNPVLTLVSARLAEANLSADLRDAFGLVQRNVQLEARLIDDLLDLTRVLHGELEIEKQPVDVSTCLEAALDLCRPDAGARKIALRLNSPTGRPRCLGDFARLQQTFWNLLRHALQFTPDAGRIEMGIAQVDDRVVVEIREPDAKISDDQLSRLFAAARHPADGFPYGRLGVGLSVAHAVIEAHGGTIAARHGDAADTLLTISLPACAAPPAADSIARPEGVTVLVVEDHEDTRRVLARALRRRGFGVMAADSVKAAVDEYLSHPADLIICDIGLPDGTGWDVLQRLRARGTSSPIRAVAVSGYGREKDVQRSRDAGFSAHIVKPVDFSQLERVVSRLLAEPTH